MDDMKKEKNEMRWQMLMWRMVIVICIATFMLAWMMYGSESGNSGIGVGAYVMRYIVTPIIVQIFTVIIGLFLIKSKKVSIVQKNYIVTAMIFIVLNVNALAYYKISPLILLPCLTIVATAMFADQLLTFWASLGVLVLMIVNIVRLREYSGSDDPRWYWMGTTCVCIVFVALLCAMVVVVNMHTLALLTSIADSHNRQGTLMSELMTDPMTGLYNRRSFEETLEKEILEVENTGVKSYVAIFDIDHFKNVNDTYGHSNGDIVIKALCKMMKDKSKGMGLAFRYGGEEFVILFHDTTLPKVMNVVEDVRTEFRCYYFHFMNNDGITCSCGVAEYAKGEDYKAWFNRADSALYKAKESGRNRTVISDIEE